MKAVAYKCQRNADPKAKKKSQDQQGPESNGNGNTLKEGVTKGTLYITFSKNNFPVFTATLSMFLSTSVFETNEKDGIVVVVFGRETRLIAIPHSGSVFFLNR